MNTDIDVVLVQVAAALHYMIVGRGIVMGQSGLTGVCWSI